MSQIWLFRQCIGTARITSTYIVTDATTFGFASIYLVAEILLLRAAALAQQARYDEARKELIAAHVLMQRASRTEASMVWYSRGIEHIITHS